MIIDKKVKISLQRAKGRCKYHSPRNTKSYINKGIKCELTLEETLFMK